MPTKEISQSVLSKILKARKKIDDLKADLAELETALETDLKEGFEVAPGILRAFIKTWERRDVSWKEVVVREKGQEYADRVLAATKPTQHSKLVVESV